MLHVIFAGTLQQFVFGGPVAWIIFGDRGCTP